jgi:hypothetical protein
MPALSECLRRLGLAHVVAAAQEWCVAEEIASLEEFMDNVEEFVQTVPLERQEQQKIENGLASIVVFGARAQSLRLGGTVPLEVDGFCISFLANESQQVHDFFNEYGFVVLRNVLTQEQCDATLDEFWEQHRAAGVDKDLPETWNHLWDTPTAERFSFAGIIGLMPDIKSQQQLENRQNLSVYDAFTAVLGDERLIVDHDRLGVMRPTVAVPGADGPVDHPDWRTRARWLHLDCNPHSAGTGKGYASIGSFRHNGDPVDFTQTLLTQGLLTLTDASEKDGGFHCVPGGHRFAMEWAGIASQYRRTYCTKDNIQVAEDDPLQSMVHPVPLRRGCLLVWNSLLFHGNRPNHSSRFRVVQYIRMLPFGTPYCPLLDATDQHLLPNDFCISSLGKKLFGFTEWPETTST